MLNYHIGVLPYTDPCTLLNGAKVECLGITPDNHIEYENTLADISIQLPVQINYTWINRNMLKISCPETVIEGDYPNQPRIDVNDLQPYFNVAANLLRFGGMSLEMLVSKSHNVYQIVTHIQKPFSKLFVIQLRIPYRYRLECTIKRGQGLVLDIVPGIQVLPPSRKNDSTFRLTPIINTFKI